MGRIKGEEGRAPQVRDWPGVCREVGMDLRGGWNQGGSQGLAGLEVLVGKDFNGGLDQIRPQKRKQG